MKIILNCKCLLIDNHSQLQLIIVLNCKCFSTDNRSHLGKFWKCRKMSNFAVEIFVLTFLSVLPGANARPNCITKFSFCQELFSTKSYPHIHNVEKCYPQPVDKSIENYSQVKFDKSRNRFSVATYSQLVNFSIFYFCVSISF